MGVPAFIANANPQSDATQLLGSIPFHALIGNPLVAAIDAQTLAAGATLKFILSALYGKDMFSSDSSDLNQFINGGNDNDVISVTLNYKSGGQDVSITVPLLTIVPIPYIAINTMTIDFTANINASTSFNANQASSTDTSAGVGASGGFWGCDVNAYAGYSSKQSSTATQDSKYAVEYTMNIHVQAGNEDMPQGLATVLNLLNKSISNSGSSGS